ncbi:MAG: transcription elongation factor GreB [Pseudomonadota bacterium]
MSKAFTKESDEEAPEPESPDPLPKGQKNYVTPNGIRLLREEYDALRRVERPKIVEVVAWAAGNGDRSENGDYIYGKKRLREIDRRLHYLLKRIESAQVVDPSEQKNRDQVFFGAHVTYLDADEADADDGDKAQESSVRIVGIDEALSERGTVSWVSPIARALLKAEEGDVVAITTPAGTKHIEIIEISYGDAA